jgi:hypothetical protein
MKRARVDGSVLRSSDLKHGINPDQMSQGSNRYIQRVARGLEQKTPYHGDGRLVKFLLALASTVNLVSGPVGNHDHIVT